MKKGAMAKKYLLSLVPKDRLMHCWNDCWMKKDSYQMAASGHCQNTMKNILIL